MVAIAVILTVLCLLVGFLLFKNADNAMRCERLEKANEQNAAEMRAALELQRKIMVRLDKIEYKP